MLTSTAVAEAMRQAREGELLAPAALAELQERKLRDLICFAVQHSPFYARHYRGLDPQRVALGDLPIVTKALVQEHFDEVVTDPRVKLDAVKEFCRPGRPAGDSWLLGEFAVMLSSGTSGQRGYYVLDSAGLADVIAVGYRQSNRGPAPAQPAPQRIAAVMLQEPFDAAGLLMQLIPEAVGPKCLLDIRQDFAALCTELNAFQPTGLSSFPYVLRMLCEAAAEGRLHIRPGRITSSGDVLTESDRRRIQAAFGVAPHDYYCSTEAAYLAWECDAHDGLHVNADHVLLESVDAGNRPVPPGILGDKILVTNLSNRVMPLIRYEMSDQVEYATAPCPCGCRLPRIRTVAGRIEHVLGLPGAAGTPVLLIEEYVDDFIGRVESVARYQVIQETAARLTVNVIIREGGPWDDVRRAVLDSLERCFCKYGVEPARLQVDLRRVDQLEPAEPGSRKVCRFWNRVR